jgi:hypothetical protein
MGRLTTRTGFWLTAMAFLLAGFAARAEGTEGSVCDKPLAMVEGKVITASEVEEQIQPQIRALAGQYEGAELAKRIAELRQITATDMAEEELLYAEFKNHEEFKVPQEMVRRRMDSIIQMQAGGSREKFEQRLLTQGASWNEFEERVRKSVAVELLLDQFVRRQVRITPAEIRDYYAKHPAEFSTAARLRLSMIQLKPDGKYAGSLRRPPSSSGMRSARAPISAGSRRTTPRPPTPKPRVTWAGSRNQTWPRRSARQSRGSPPARSLSRSPWRAVWSCSR